MTTTRGWLDALVRPATRPAPGMHLSQLIATVVREYRTRRAIQRVAGLDDRMLHDIGIGRSEIEHAVGNGRRAI